MFKVCVKYKIKLSLWLHYIISHVEYLLNNYSWKSYSDFEWYHLNFNFNYAVYLYEIWDSKYENNCLFSVENFLYKTWVLKMKINTFQTFFKKRWIPKVYVSLKLLKSANQMSWLICFFFLYLTGRAVKRKWCSTHRTFDAQSLLQCFKTINTIIIIMK